MRLICCIYRYHYINNRVFKYFQSIYAVARSQSLAVNLISIKWKSLSGFDFFLEVSLKKKNIYCKSATIQRMKQLRNNQEQKFVCTTRLRRYSRDIEAFEDLYEDSIFFLSYSVINRHKLFVA